jgi:hypothetical protein
MIGYFITTSNRKHADIIVHVAQFFFFFKLSKLMKLLLLNKRSDGTQSQRAKRSYSILRKPQKKNSSFHLVKWEQVFFFLFSFFFFFLSYFVKVVKWWSYISIFSQFWGYQKYEKQKIAKHLFIL